MRLTVELDCLFRLLSMSKFIPVGNL